MKADPKLGRSDCENESSQQIGGFNLSDFIEQRGRYWVEMADRLTEKGSESTESNNGSGGTILLKVQGSSGVFGIFEDDGLTGYLYLDGVDPRGGLIDFHIYNRLDDLLVTEGDVRVVWSNDQKKCGVLIYGVMRGVIDLVSLKRVRPVFAHKDAPGIEDPAVLDGFNV